MALGIGLDSMLTRPCLFPRSTISSTENRSREQATIRGMNQTGRLAFLRGPKGLGVAFFLLFFFLMGRWVDSGSLIFSAGGLVASVVVAGALVASGSAAGCLVGEMVGAVGIAVDGFGSTGLVLRGLAGGGLFAMADGGVGSIGLGFAGWVGSGVWARTS